MAAKTEPEQLELPLRLEPCEQTLVDIARVETLRRHGTWAHPDYYEIKRHIQKTGFRP